MRNKRLLTAFLLGAGLYFVPVFSMADEQIRDGYVWTQLSPEAKACFVDGYAEGMSRVLNCPGFGGVVQLGEEWHGSKDVLDWLKALYERFMEEYPPDIRIIQAVEGIDSFYADFRNKAIPMSLSTMVVFRQLRSESEEDVNQLIEILRREAQERHKEES